MAVVADIFVVVVVRRPCAGAAASAASSPRRCGIHPPSFPQQVHLQALVIPPAVVPAEAVEVPPVVGVACWVILDLGHQR